MDVLEKQLAFVVYDNCLLYSGFFLVAIVRCALRNADAPKMCVHFVCVEKRIFNYVFHLTEHVPQCAPCVDVPAIC